MFYQEDHENDTRLKQLPNQSCSLDLYKCYS